MKDRTRRKARQSKPGRSRARRSPWLGGAVTVAIITVGLPAAVVFSLAFFAGWRFENVRTGSMWPTYDVDSLLVVSPIDPSDVEAGMPVTFVDPVREGGGRLVTHRVERVKVDEQGELSFVTKGDANVRRDPEAVPAQNIRSQVRWHIPELGGILEDLVGWKGYALFLGLPATVIVVGEIRDRRRAKRAGDEPIAVGLDAACTLCEAPVGTDYRYCQTCGARQHHPEPDSEPGPAEAEVDHVDVDEVDADLEALLASAAP